MKNCIVNFLSFFGLSNYLSPLRKKPAKTQKECNNVDAISHCLEHALPCRRVITLYNQQRLLSTLQCTTYMCIRTCPLCIVLKLFDNFYPSLVRDASKTPNLMYSQSQTSHEVNTLAREISCVKNCRHLNCYNVVRKNRITIDLGSL